jgi:hypothetical protein
LTNTQQPKLVGENIRYQDVCEDLPVGSLIYSLRAFDPMLNSNDNKNSRNKLCYSVSPNEYFSLKIDGSSDGNVYLKKKIDFELVQKTCQNFKLNFSAALFHCDTPEILLDRQVIIVNVLPVNKYPPLLIQKVRKNFKF